MGIVIITVNVQNVPASINIKRTGIETVSVSACINHNRR